MELTSAAETAEVAAWAQQYPEVEAEIDDIREGLESYAQAHAVAPDPSVKQKLFSAINMNKATPVIELKTGDKVAVAKLRIVMRKRLRTAKLFRRHGTDDKYKTYQCPKVCR